MAARTPKSPTTHIPALPPVCKNNEDVSASSFFSPESGNGAKGVFGDFRERRPKPGVGSRVAPPVKCNRPAAAPTSDARRPCARRFKRTICPAKYATAQLRIAHLAARSATIKRTNGRRPWPA
jgi:hypothetical protein